MGQYNLFGPEDAIRSAVNTNLLAYVANNFGRALQSICTPQKTVTRKCSTAHRIQFGNIDENFSAVTANIII